MMALKTIGFIGAGNMGEALVKGMLQAGLVKPAQIMVSDVDAKKLQNFKKRYGVKTVQDNAELCRKASIIVLAVKPQQAADVLGPLRGAVSSSQTVISIMAGVRTDGIQKFFAAKVPVVRVMPNTPALIGRGMAVISKGRYAKAAHEKAALQIFGAVGDALALPEKYLDAVTAVSGSGPAYVFYLIEALRDAGARAGLPSAVAERLALQTVAGAGVMAQEHYRHYGEKPELLRQRVTSKKGTTEAALKVFEKRGFKKTVAGAVAAAAKRSRQLSRGGA